MSFVIFGSFGYPSILHIDNGTEFTSTEIISAMKKLNEQILIFTYQPRNPTDQGSVEFCKKQVKGLIKSQENVQFFRGETLKWTKKLRKVMSAVNSLKKHSAYEAVFGMKYHVEYSCTDLEIYKCVIVSYCLHLSFYKHIESQKTLPLYVEIYLNYHNIKIIIQMMILNLNNETLAMKIYLHLG